MALLVWDMKSKKLSTRIKDGLGGKDQGKRRLYETNNQCGGAKERKGKERKKRGDLR